MTNQDAIMMNSLIVVSATVLLFVCAMGVYLSFKFSQLQARTDEIERFLYKVIENSTKKPKRHTNTTGPHKYKTEVLYCNPDGNVIKKIQGFEANGNPLNFASIFSEETGTIISCDFEIEDNPSWNGDVYVVCEKSNDPKYSKTKGLKPIGYLYFQYDN